ncbi:MAG: gliding motility-associated C-terminal domain-containing protein [Bacteroidota bacterium]
MKTQLLFLFCSLLTVISWAQPNDCTDAVPGCTTPSFAIEPNNPATNIVDFTSGSISNPSSNPNGSNSGCLLSGETSSTFITINIVSSGVLEWSMIGVDASGNPTNSGCFDWIMWPNVGGNACAGINGNTLPPVACNWNGSCNGNTGMSSAGNLPPSGSWTSYEAPLAVTAGQSFVLCLSNYSGLSGNVNLDFFGTATVSCDPAAGNQTICLGSSANVVINNGGLPSPTYEWLVTNGVPNVNGGPNVTVTPAVTTTYQVEIEQAAVPGTPYFIDTISFTITVVNPPTPNAGPDQTVCLGSPILLHGVPSSASNSANWQAIVPPGLSPPATANFAPNFSNMNPTVTVNQPGIYKFILRETSTVCGTFRDTLTVVVSELSASALQTSPSCAGLADGQITITSVGATEYSFNNGGTWGASNTQGGFTAGAYTVCARNALGCQKCVLVNVIDPAPVVVSVSNDTLICQNGTASLVASAIGGVTYTYNWSHSPSLLPNQPVNPLAATTYTVVAVNQNGCASLPATIDVTVRPPLSATITPTQSVCPGYPATISVNGSGGIGQPYNYTWSTGFVQNGVSSSITESPLVTTVYTVTVDDACESTPFVINTQITALPVPIPLIAVDEPVKCEPALFILTNQTDPAMSAANYWRISDGQEFFNTDLISPEALYAGVYDVQLIVTSPDGCIDSTTFVDYLNVHSKPIADFKWSPDPVTMFNTVVTLTNYSFGADTYEWSVNGGTPGASTNTDMVTVFPDGITGYYDVTLISTSYLGCKDTAIRTIPVMPEVLIYVPNTFTPDGDEFNQTWQIHMEGVDRYNFEVMVFNRWGEVVWESHNIDAEWDGTYHGEIVKNGSYTWVIRAKDILSDKKLVYQGTVNVNR